MEGNIYTEVLIILVLRLIKSIETEMTLYTRLQIPTFDLIWVDIDGHYYIFCPGGGGATKSGLRNGIQIFEEKDDILTLNFFHETVFSGKSTFVFQLCASNHQVRHFSKLVSTLY